MEDVYVSYRNYRETPSDQIPRREKLSALEVERAKGATPEAEAQKLDERASKLAARAASTREDVGTAVERVEVEKVDVDSAKGSSYRIGNKLMFGLYLTNFALQGFLAVSHIVSGKGVWWLNLVAATCWGLCAAFQIKKD